jgi:DNA polymerase-3 subunit alpha
MKTLTFDIETTGLPVKNANYEVDFMTFPFIVTLAYKINDEETKYIIVNQEGIDIPEESTKIHGITSAIANTSNYTVSMALLEMLEDAQGIEKLIGFNIYFDTSIIKANILRLITANNVPPNTYEKFQQLLDKEKRLDLMQKTIKFCGLGNKYPKLTELYFKLFNEEFNAHNSKDDVDATYKCYLKLLELKVI